MKVNYQGNRDAKIVLLQIIGEHELPLLEEELSHIKAITQSTDFLFITVQRPGRTRTGDAPYWAGK